MAEAESPPGELSIEDAAEIAVRAHRAGDVAVAEAVYGRILAVAPDHATILHYYGILHHQTKRHLEAVRLIRRAIEIAPEDPAMHSNLGNVFLELDRPDYALKAYQTAIILDPASVDARNNLGVALRAMRLLDEAEIAYREALDIDPNHREAWDNLGRLLAGRGRIEEAITCHAKALELEPANAGTRRFLVAAYAATNANDRAIAILRDWLREEPNSAAAQHLMAAISGENVPDRASERYVEGLFDTFAASFDHKLARLDYRAPDLIAGAVSALYAPGAGLDILDAGCGTGLCGPALRGLARSLAGVDLSAKMLDKAGDRNCYDHLERGELTAYLGSNPASYDLVVCADTLCYFGRLDPVCAAVVLALRPGGRFVFSVEDGTGEAGFTLHTHGRYSHTRAYVEDTLSAAGLRVDSVVRDTLRMERGQPVFGLVVTAHYS